MFIDTHCHLEKSFYNDINKVIDDNKNAKIEYMIVSGCNKDEIDEVLRYAKVFEMVYLTVGFHPDTCKDITDEDIFKLEKIIKENDKIVGIGEIGLDYHYGKGDRELQIDLFKKQLDLASKLDLPVVIHTRDAYQDTFDILKDYNLKGIIHCFSGSYEVANSYIKLGYLLGIGGVVTFKNSKLGDTLKKLSLDNLVLETDSPYLAPEPYRGSLNSSKNIPLIAERLSNIYNKSKESVAKVTTNNAFKIFNIK